MLDLKGIEMRLSEKCAVCLYDKQKKLVQDEDYLAEVRELLENRDPEDTSPYMVYLFDRAFVSRFGDQGETSRYRAIKQTFNDLVLSMEDAVRQRIEAAEDPLAASVLFARIGNYIDFGTMHDVSKETFLGLFDDPKMGESDRRTYHSFLKECAKAKSFLLIADNCGEIVLDKLFLEQLAKRFPQLEMYVLVRGDTVLNDVTPEDAAYVGIDHLATIVSNGAAIPGTVYRMLSEDARRILDTADVILAKGQGNYESLSNQGRHIFYVFLCKCDLFTWRFQVPRLTGMFVEEES